MSLLIAEAAGSRVPNGISDPPLNADGVDDLPLDAGSIDGFALLAPAGSGMASDPPDAAYLSLLAVHPRAQGRGLGNLLLKEITRDAAAAGYDRLVLHVVADNARARRLYDAGGWTVLGEPFAHPITGRESVTYVRDLA
ncbi:GNAT family N-acetyltransferase [Rathayibacter sp. YIM 133350]|uniref:GNAT family N-acetyltransferase n=1 Tax=Rathayibacter sp. YIM 133350 TaxID=3131992 RepID=UPI00307D8C0D